MKILALLSCVCGVANLAVGNHVVGIFVLVASFALWNEHKLKGSK
jgi:hypothetical protein